MTTLTIATEGEGWIDRVKVPVVIILSFWIIKILATTVGETASDFLTYKLTFGLIGTSGTMAALLAAVLAAQLRWHRYIPWLYWLTVVLISITGTLITDLLTDYLEVPLELSTAVFTVALAATFLAWYKSERTLSIHSIFTQRREAFYWLAILFTFALGTAGGDLAAEKLDWGYGLSALVFGAAIAAVALACFRFGANAVAAFWIAYVLTRPFGATCADLLSKHRGEGGIGLGTMATTIVFSALILVLVGYLTVSRKDSPLSPLLAASADLPPGA